MVHEILGYQSGAACETRFLFGPPAGWFEPEATDARVAALSALLAGCIECHCFGGGATLFVDGGFPVRY